MAIQSFIDENGEEWFYNDDTSQTDPIQFKNEEQLMKFTNMFELRNFNQNRMELQSGDVVLYTERNFMPANIHVIEEGFIISDVVFNDRYFSFIELKDFEKNRIKLNEIKLFNLN